MHARLRWLAFGSWLALAACASRSPAVEATTADALNDVPPALSPETCSPPSANHTWVGFADEAAVEDFGDAQQRAEQITSLLHETACSPQPELDPSGSLRSSLAQHAMVIKKVIFTRAELDTADAELSARDVRDGDAPSFRVSLRFVAPGWELVSITPRR